MEQKTFLDTNFILDLINVIKNLIVLAEYTLINMFLTSCFGPRSAPIKDRNRRY